MAPTRTAVSKPLLPGNDGAIAAWPEVVLMDAHGDTTVVQLKVWVLPVFPGMLWETRRLIYTVTNWACRLQMKKLASRDFALWCAVSRTYFHEKRCCLVCVPPKPSETTETKSFGRSRCGAATSFRAPLRAASRGWRLLPLSSRRTSSNEPVRCSMAFYGVSGWQRRLRTLYFSRPATAPSISAMSALWTEPAATSVASCGSCQSLGSRATHSMLRL